MYQFKFSLVVVLFLAIGLNLSQALSLPDIEVNSQGRTKFDDDLRDFVEFIKLQMQCGYEPAGIPPLAPYQEDYRQSQLEGNTWSFKGNLTQLQITGLNVFDVVSLSWNHIFRKFSFDFHFPSILAQSSYMLEAKTGVFGPALGFHGNGLFHLELINLRAHGSFRLRPLLSGGLAVWDFNVTLDLESSKSKTTGIMESAIYSKIFNSWFEEFIQLTFDDNAEAISEALEYLMVPPLDKAFKEISLVELVALIMGLAGDVVPTEALC